MADVAAEVAEAEAAGVPPEELMALANPQTNIADMTLTYEVPEGDKGSWRPAWRMEKGWDGLEYGKPMKLPKNGLPNYLAKKRRDGGRLFTLTMPERILGPGEFECFAAPEFCSKKLDTKGKLVDHMEDKHPREARHFAPFIKQIRDSITAENPVLAEMVAKIAGTPDRASGVDIPADIREKHDATVPVIAEQETASFSVTYNCHVCDWKPKPDGQRPEFARNLHIMKMHPEEGQ